MEQQKTNSKHQNDLEQAANQNNKNNVQSGANKPERARNSREKKYYHSKNDRNRQNEKSSKYSHRTRDYKGQGQNQGSGAGSHSRYSRRNEHSYSDSTSRIIKTTRVETVEDIIADIERIEKDIQFEIKQIRTIKLGL